MTNKTTHTLEVCYRNLHEPKKFQLYKMILQRTHSGEQWQPKHIAIYNESKDCFELIGSLYSADLVGDICATLLKHLNMENNDQHFKEKSIG
ncbi:hypothetical protein [Bacillus sp. Marseille-P3661]|uniref:hypothetical protein n=1 Tax=Bacillus sp. Marseille-P3661 TaxID=1936234 RepID=UPI00115AA965|nr:hypothetical protein [Bacillus sp. Marseille-P3661]